MVCGLTEAAITALCLPSKPCYLCASAPCRLLRTQCSGEVAFACRMIPPCDGLICSEEIMRMVELFCCLLSHTHYRLKL